MAENQTIKKQRLTEIFNAALKGKRSSYPTNRSENAFWQKVVELSGSGADTGIGTVNEYLEDIISLKFSHLEGFGIILQNVPGEPMKIDGSLLPALSEVYDFMIEHIRKDIDKALDFAANKVGHIVYEKATHQNVKHKSGTFLSVEMRHDE